MVQSPSKLYGSYDALKTSTLVGESGDEDIYLCPFCLENRGSPDTKGKFYFNRTKNIGMCQRCETIVVKEGIRDRDVIRREIDKRINPKKHEINQVYTLKNWAWPIREVGPSYQYLKSRGISNEAIDRFNIHGCRSPKMGVVFINRLLTSTTTDFFQIRKINAKAKLRYMNLRKSYKPLSWIHHADSNRFIITEGFASGISAWQHLNHEYNPIVTQGKTLSEAQLYELSEHLSQHKRSEILICLDGGFDKNAMTMSKQIHTTVHNADIRIVVLPLDLDPNDMKTPDFVERVDNSLKYTPLSENFIRGKIHEQQVALAKAAGALRG